MFLKPDEKPDRRRRKTRSPEEAGVGGKTPGWSSATLKEKLVRFKAATEAGDKVTADLIMNNELLKEISNLADTVIKMLYPGIGEGRYQELHCAAMEKCWR